MRPISALLSSNRSLTARRMIARPAVSQRSRMAPGSRRSRLSNMASVRWRPSAESTNRLRWRNRLGSSAKETHAPLDRGCKIRKAALAPDIIRQIRQGASIRLEVAIIRLSALHTRPVVGRTFHRAAPAPASRRTAPGNRKNSRAYSKNPNPKPGNMIAPQPWRKHVPTQGLRSPATDILFVGRENHGVRLANSMINTLASGNTALRRSAITWLS